MRAQADAGGASGAADGGTAVPSPPASRSWLPPGVEFTEWSLSESGIDMRLPEGLSIAPTPYGNGIFATKAFRKGEVLYATLARQVPYREGVIPLRTDKGEFSLDMITHTVRQEGDELRQLYAFDSYMNHSCNVRRPESLQIPRPCAFRRSARCPPAARPPIRVFAAIFLFNALG